MTGTDGGAYELFVDRRFQSFDGPNDNKAEKRRTQSIPSYRGAV